MRSGKRLAPQKGGFLALLERLGFTNCLAVLLVLLLLVGLAGGFVLAVLSIRYQYTGALACWTVVFTPIGIMFKSPVSIATQWIRGLFLLPWHYRGIINRYLGRFGLLGTVWAF